MLRFRQSPKIVAVLQGFDALTGIAKIVRIGRGEPA
jgi:hypothetical protein